MAEQKQVKFYRQSREEVNVNLTPLIDVVFLLLIFFMVSTTFTKETRLSLELPEAEGTPAANERQVLEITISANGRYAVQGKALVNSKRTTLGKALEEVSKSNNKLPLVIVADAQAPHQAVVTAMDVAGKQGFVNLSIATMQPDKTPE